jgi:hypothetical protein
LDASASDFLLLVCGGGDIMQIPSGYNTITPIQIANAVWALSQGIIEAHAFRVYFACFELTAIRQAARRYRRKWGESPKELILSNCNG